MTILLAPMEGLVDFVLRDILTRVGGIDRCVSGFIRVTGTLLPERAFRRIMPELDHGGRTPAGVPVRAQLLGSDPVCLAENAAKLAALSQLQRVRAMLFSCSFQEQENGGRGRAISLLNPRF